MSAKRGPIKVSGLVQSGRVQSRPLTNETQENELPSPEVESPAVVGVAAGQVHQPPAVASPAEEATHVGSRIGSEEPGQARSSGITGAASSSDDQGQKPAEAVIEDVPIAKIVTNPRYQTRIRLNDQHVEDLRITFRATGQGEPVKLRKVGDRYELLRGHHRLEAGRRESWSTIKAVVCILSDQDALRDSMLSNSNRLDETDYERALKHEKYIREGFAKNQEEVANAFGCTQARVSQLSAFLGLPDAILGLLDTYPGLLTYRGAKTVKDLLKAYPEHEDIVIKAVQRLIDDKEESSIKQWAEQMINLKTGQRVASKAVPAHVVPNAYGVVRFQTKTKGRTIIIDLKDGMDDPAEIERKVQETLRQIPEPGRAE